MSEEAPKPYDPEEDLRQKKVNQDSYEISSGRREIDEKIDDETLADLKKKLEESVAYFRDSLGDAAKFMIPLYPIKKAISEWNDPYASRDIATMEIFLGATGMNVPIGLGMAMQEAGDLIKNYKILLKTRREMRKRQEVADAIEKTEE